MPPGFEWPRWMPTGRRKSKYGQMWAPASPAPLGFIAQLDLSAIPNIEVGLPTSGWLYFFYDRYCEPWGFDPRDRGCCRVVYVDCPHASLQRVELPPDFEEEHLAHTCSLEATVELTLPELSWEEYGTPQYDAYNCLMDRLQAEGSTENRFLGHPQPIQNPMELECQLASNGIDCGGAVGFREEEVKALEAGAVDWRLLLQIDTDEDGPGWMWGDVGRIYFWIKRQDLAALQFADVWLVLQCS